MDSDRFSCLSACLGGAPQTAGARYCAYIEDVFFHCFKHASQPVYDSLKSGLLGVSIYGVDAETPNRLISHACQAILELHSGESRRIAFYDRDIHLQVERKKAFGKPCSSSAGQRLYRCLFPTDCRCSTAENYKV
ncbi:hypothetical protein QW180_16890 [Vibrio sinaloensis]|nr:hypothetical protein [Vibrio sinaloensis]